MSDLTLKRADLYTHIKQAEIELHRAADDVMRFGLTEEQQVEQAEMRLKGVISYLTECSPYNFSDVCTEPTKDAPND